MAVKQRQDDYFAITLPGLEEICAAELEQIGIASPRPVPGGVEFSGPLRTLYLANLWSRTATRVVVRVGDVAARDFPALYRKVVRLPWGRYLRPDDELDVRVSCQRSRLGHSGRVAETVSEAVGHALGTTATGTGRARVLVRMEDDRCYLSVDSSGELLHRRGYRHSPVAAPLRETLAAAILMTLGWRGESPLVDAMAGSGTFVIEAALIACRRPPGRNRRFAFMDWPGYRSGVWNLLLQDADRQQRAVPCVLQGSDIDDKAIVAAIDNAKRAGVADFVNFTAQPMQQLQPPADSGLILCNPPYGERIGTKSGLSELYRELGELYTGSFAQWQSAMLCPCSEIDRVADLNWHNRLVFSNGGVKVALLERTRVETT
ncbi:MAG: class I SAM-dependent RNA methyltransferase [Desulfuromonas sp.]|nr:MAG: class I SAM-dependent RNA methyltransferase [Desulfuromonas sp.]